MNIKLNILNAYLSIVYQTHKNTLWSFLQGFSKSIMLFTKSLKITSRIQSQFYYNSKATINLIKGKAKINGDF